MSRASSPPGPRKTLPADPRGGGGHACSPITTSRLGQLDKAVAEFASLTAKYPDNISLQKGYIRALLQTHNDEAARTAVVAPSEERAPETPKLKR